MFRSFLKAIFPATFVVLLFLLSPQVLLADTLRLSPDSGSYEVGQTFPVHVFVSSQQSINAVSGVVGFPADKLQVVSLSKTNSILTLWVQEPSFSNSLGTASFEGVVPNPGYIGSGGIVVTINFRVVGSGTAALKFNSGAILANDGSGTNILRNLNTASYTLVGSVQAPTPAAEVTTSGADSGAFVVTSTTHPNPQEWYAESDAKFAWNLPGGTKAARLLLGKLPNSTPSVLYEPAIDEKKLSDTADGIWYFHVQLRNADGWGPITHRQFRVDTLPPENFSIKKVEGDEEDLTNPKPQFFFSVTDVMSGVDHFTIELDKKKPETWKNSGNSIYQLPLLGPGNHSILAKAYDKAGNSSVASIDFTILGIEKPKITSYDSEISNDDILIINGTALPNIGVRLVLTPTSGETITRNVDSDEEGDFTAAIEGKGIPKGVYKLTATAVDTRGAESEPTSAKTIMIKTSWLESVAGSIIKTLAFLVPLVALLFFLWYVGMHGFHKVRRSRANLRKELMNVDRLVEKSFDLLKEDVSESVKMLEHAKTKRQLTKEEDAIVRRLSHNLSEAEKIIHKQMSKAESLVDTD